MAIKAARDSFRKDDIIEILKRNVALYKDEKEFVDYIVNLAMYLMDQYYGPGEGPQGVTFPDAPGLGSVSEDLDNLSGEIPVADVKPPAPIHKASEILPATSSDLPPTAQERARRQAEADRRSIPRFETKASVPGTNAFDIGPEMPATPRDALSGSKKQPDAPTDNPNNMPSRKAIEVERSPLITPTSDVTREPKRGAEKREAEAQGFQRAKDGDDRDSSPHVDISNQGRTRVYRVVRPYKSGTAVEQPCPICGGMVPLGEKQCQGCGHIM